MKKKLLLCDLVIGENICNQKCDYCLTKYDNYNDKDKFLNENYRYAEGTDLHNRLNVLLDNLLEEFEVAALKIIGGEIFMVQNIIALLEERSHQFVNVQLMSNGIAITEEKIERLKKIKNFHMQISVDSSNFEGNFYRNKNEKVHERLLHNIDSVIKAGIPLEINCVLTDRSIEYLEEYLRYLGQYEGAKLKVYAFPVRGNESEVYFPRKEQFEIIQRIIDNYDSYGSIMPPVQYYENLLAFLKEGKRQRECSIPFHSFQAFENGEVTPCPYWWTTNIGNLITDAEKVKEASEKNPIYRMIYGGTPRLAPCKKCYIRSEVQNLYFEGALTLEELATIPFYQDEKIKEYLIDLKEDYIAKHGGK